MKKEHVEFLYKHKVMYNNFKSSGVIAHLPVEDAKVFLEIAKTFQPEYNASLWCGDCVMDMVSFVYTQASKLPKEEPKPNEEDGYQVISEEEQKQSSEQRNKQREKRRS